MGVESLPETHRIGNDLRLLTQRPLAFGKGQQYEGLIVEKRPVVERRTVRGDQRAEQTVRPAIVIFDVGQSGGNPFRRVTGPT
jgi:hypothetical protein